MPAMNNATLTSMALHCIKIPLDFQRVVAGLKPSFSVDFSVNEGYFVSNIVVVLVGSKVAIVKQPKIVKQLINTGKIKMQRSFGDRCIVSKLNAVAKKSSFTFR